MKAKPFKLDNNFVLMSQYVLRLVLTCLATLAITFLLDRYSIIKLNNTMLVTITSILEMIVLIKTVGKDLGRVFSSEDIRAIEEGRSANKNKFLSLFLCIIQNEIRYVLPYYVAYAVLRSVGGSFIINSIIALFALAVIIMAWSLVIYGVYRLISSSLHCTSKRMEVLIKISLLIVSALFLLSKEGVMLGKTSTNIVNFYNNITTLLQTFGLSFDSNLAILVNIVAIFLVVECVVACVKFVHLNTELIIKLADDNIVELPSDTRAALFNTIRPCLARSPTV